MSDMQSKLTSDLAQLVEVMNQGQLELKRQKILLNYAKQQMLFAPIVQATSIFEDLKDAGCIDSSSTLGPAIAEATEHLITDHGQSLKPAVVS